MGAGRDGSEAAAPLSIVSNEDPATADLSGGSKLPQINMPNVMSGASGLLGAHAGTFGEMVGTFILGLTVALSSNGGLAVAAGLFALYATNATGMFNPVFPMNDLINRNGNPVDHIKTIIGQMAGAFLAAACANGIANDAGTDAFTFHYEGQTGYAILMSALFTHLWMTTHAKQGEGEWSTLATAFSVFAGISTVGAQAGCFNPALGTTIPIVGGEDLSTVYISWVGPLCACLLGKVLNFLTGEGGCLHRVADHINEMTSAFYLTLIITSTQGDDTGLVTAAAIMVCMYNGRTMSNPGLNIASWMSGDRGAQETVFDTASQLIGAFVGAELTKQTGELVAQTVADGTSNNTALLCEMLFTYLVIRVARTSGEDNKPLAVGLATLAGVVAVGSFSGSTSFNPIIAQSANGILDADADTWVYWVGPILGGVFTCVMDRVFGGDDAGKGEAVASESDSEEETKADDQV